MVQQFNGLIVQKLIGSKVYYWIVGHYYI